MVLFDSRFCSNIKSSEVYDVILTDKIFLAMPLLKFRCKKIIIYFVSKNNSSNANLLYQLQLNQNESVSKAYKLIIGSFLTIHKAVLLFLNLFAIILIGFVVDGVLTDCYTMQNYLI